MSSIQNEKAILRTVKKIRRIWISDLYAKLETLKKDKKSHARHP